MKAEDEKPQNLSAVFNTGTWSPAEDGRLKEAVAKHGTRWVIVATEVGTRNGDQCSKRWKENLNPDLDHSPWSSWEDKLLLNLVEVCGHNWKFMASSFLEARSPLSLKNRHSLLMRRIRRQGSSRKQQSSPIENTSPTVPYPYQLGEHLDVASGFSADEAGSGSSTPFRGSRSDTEGESTASTSRVGSMTDLANLYGITDSHVMGSHHVFSTPFGSIAPEDTPQYPSEAVHMGWEQQTSWEHEFNTSISFSSISGPSSSIMEPDKTADVVSSRPVNDRQHQHHQQRHQRAHQMQNTKTSSYSEQPIAYSVSCQRGKLKTLAHHLVDAVVSEANDRLADDDQVTLTLRLEK
ncbi:hypothetical protein F4775DRAFT_539019 [Biscogniauxia sp. FL1348]|nr:hypothetical protein F4775DRAFT_539019 [Biscogniauxia sp. FL1348]